MSEAAAPVTSTTASPPPVPASGAPAKQQGRIGDFMNAMHDRGNQGADALPVSPDAPAPRQQSGLDRAQAALDARRQGQEALADEQDPAALDPNAEQPELDTDAPPDLAALLEAFQQDGVLKGELFENGLVPIKVAGQEVLITAKEAAEGYMRNVDYSKGKREVQEYGRRVQAAENGVRAFLTDLNRGDTFLGAVQKLGPAVSQAFDQAVEMRAIELHRVMQMAPEQQQLYWGKKQLEQQAAAQQQELARLRQLAQQQEQQRQGPSQEQQIVTHQLQQFVPRAFAKHNLGAPSKPGQAETFAERMFRDHLDTVYDGSGPLSAAVIEQAARATREQIDELQMQGAPQQPGAGSRALSATRMPGRGGQPANGKGAKISDFSSRVMGR